MNFQEVHYGTYNFISNTVCDYLLLRTVFNSESVTFSASAVEFVNLNTSRSIDLRYWKENNYFTEPRSPAES